MRQLPSNDGMPHGLTIEKPAGGLASLTLTDNLRSITDQVILQWQNEEAFDDLARFGIFPTRQLLFYGPPGNGKTTACQWIASKLDAPLYRVRCEQLISSYFGQTANLTGQIMDWLENQEKCVVLFDEIESIFPARGLGEAARELASAMTVFWQRLDRWRGPQLFVMATNMADRLDPALLSRIELHMEFGPPTVEQARSVLTYWAETLHEYGADVWSESIGKLIDKSEKTSRKLPFESFRSLWQTIQRGVLDHVSKSIA